jgi:NHS family xanthosine MFS transporter
MFLYANPALAITVSYTSMKNTGMDIIKDYRLLGLGDYRFHSALWVVSLLKFETSSMQFYLAAVSSFLLGLYAFTLPKCPPLGRGHKKKLAEELGLNAFRLFKSIKMALFFIFAMLLGGALQLTNAYGRYFPARFR